MGPNKSNWALIYFWISTLSHLIAFYFFLTYILIIKLWNNFCKAVAKQKTILIM